MAREAVSTIGLVRTTASRPRPARGSAGAHLLVDEVDQQDRVAHDDAGERDHADHRGGRELGAEQGMAGQDADDGQRDRRHDHQRHQ